EPSTASTEPTPAGVAGRGRVGAGGRVALVAVRRREGEGSRDQRGEERGGHEVAVHGGLLEVVALGTPRAVQESRSGAPARYLPPGSRLGEAPHVARPVAL